jgi:hypothetical protein
MNKHPFKFSTAARLYAKNLDLIDEISVSKAKEARQLHTKYKNDIGEMRAEAYRNIANFRDLLVNKLDSETWQSKCIHKKDTYTVGAWAGGIIHYRWFDAVSKNQIVRSLPCIGMIHFVFPRSHKVKIINDAQWKDEWQIFNILSSDRLKVTITYDGPNSRALDKIMGLKEKRQLGTFDRLIEYWKYSIWLSLDRADPVGSATKRIVALLREIYLAQYPR